MATIILKGYWLLTSGGQTIEVYSPTDLPEPFRPTDRKLFSDDGVHYGVEMDRITKESSLDEVDRILYEHRRAKSLDSSLKME